MKCSNCGFENDSSSTSCIVCGISLIDKKTVNNNDGSKKDISVSESKKYVASYKNNPENINRHSPSDKNNDGISNSTFNYQKESEDRKNNFNNYNNENIQKDTHSFIDEAQKKFDDISDKIQDSLDEKSIHYFVDEVKTDFDDENSIGNYEYENNNGDNQNFFTTRNVAIFCLILIVLTLVICINILILNGVSL